MSSTSISRRQFQKNVQPGTLQEIKKRAADKGVSLNGDQEKALKDADLNKNGVIGDSDQEVLKAWKNIDSLDKNDSSRSVDHRKGGGFDVARALATNANPRANASRDRKWAREFKADLPAKLKRTSLSSDEQQRIMDRTQGLKGSKLLEETRQLDQAFRSKNPETALLQQSLSKDKNFKALPLGVQADAQSALAKNAKDPAARESLRQLATSPGLQGLSEADQSRLVKNASRNDDTVGKYTRESVNNLLKSPAYQSAAPAGQATQLKTILDRSEHRATLTADPNFQHLNKDTREQVLSQMDGHVNNPTARRNLSQLITDPRFSKISRAHQKQALDTLASRPNDAALTRNLRSITSSRNFRKMNDVNKTRVLRMVSNNATNSAYGRDLASLVRHRNFDKLSTSDQGRALNVFHNTTPAGRRAFQTVMSRRIKGKMALTTGGYGRTGTLLSQLDRLSTTNPDARLTQQNGTAISRSAVTEQLLQEVANPDRHINQHNRGTCTVTSMSHTLARHNPAEYARLVTDLATTGQSRLANGQTIQVPGQGAWRQDNSNRSHPERLLQSALMDYGRPGANYQNWNAGADGTRNTADDGFPDPTNPNLRSLDGFADRNGSGLTPDEEVRVLEGLHGREYEVYTGSRNFRDDQKDMTNRIQSELRKTGTPVQVNVRWGSGGSHAVEVTRVQNGRVYFRNPWGGGNVGATGTNNGTAANSTGAGPTRRVEDGTTGEESMTMADFRKHILRVYVQD